MRRPPHPILLVVAAAWIAAASAMACTAGRPPPPPEATSTSRPPGDQVVARVGGIAIYQSDVAAAMRLTGTAAPAALEDLIRFELLALAARSQGAAADPAVREAAAATAVQRLIEREIEPGLGKDQIPEPVLREVYEKAKKSFVHPRLVEVGMLSIYTGARMKDEPRARAAETARALEAAVRLQRDRTIDDLQAIAADPAWKSRRVHFGRVWQAIDEPFPAEVGREVQRLLAPGDTTPMVTAETGFHLARYIGERPAENVSFDEARDKLREQIYERWRMARFLEITGQLAGGHVIEAYPERLEAPAR